MHIIVIIIVLPGLRACLTLSAILIVTGGSSSGMVYEDVEKLYAEVHADAEALVENALHVLYPGSLPLTSAVPKSSLEVLTVFEHNTTPFT